MGPSADSERPAARLSRVELGVCLAISLAVFFLYQGPVWRHRWQIDGSIWTSYLVIPFVVAGVLFRAHKFEVRELALGTLEVACWKFGATYLLANTVWMFSAPPPHAAAPSPSSPIALPVRPARRRVSADAAGTISGTVSVEGAVPVFGGVVFIESGLEEYEWAEAPMGASFSVKAGAIEPRLAVAELYGEVRARSIDGTLHTLIASQGDSDLFSLPLQSSGAMSSAELRRGQGVAALRCAVHERSTESARLVVVAHPFHTLLEERGHFEWSGVPAGRVTLVALLADGRTARLETDVLARKVADVALVIGAER